MKILIAGSSSGIGRATAEKMLAENNQVVGLARHHAKFSPNTPHYTSYSIDFSQIDEIENQFKQVKNEHADVDVLVCSVGYGEFAELEQFSVNKMQQILNVNFLSQAILIKTFLPSFKKNKSGKIIIIGSECALEGQKKASLYCATKFALRGFAQSIRKECAAANVAVTLINPGLVNTPFFDKLTFQPARGEAHVIESTQIAELIATIVKTNNNCIYEEINLQPLKNMVEKRLINILEEEK